MVSRTLTNTNLSSNFSCIIEMARIAEKYPQGRFILRTSTNADAEALRPIYLYYCCCGKKIRYNTGIRTKINDWNENDGKLRASYGENYKKNNQILTKMVAKINNQIIDYVTLNGAISPDIIKAFTNGDDKPLRADKGQSLRYLRARFTSISILGKKSESQHTRILSLSSINSRNVWMKWVTTRTMKSLSVT